MNDRDERRFDTLAVSFGEHADPAAGPGDVVSPIHLASTYALPGLDTDLSLEDIDPDKGEFVYSRLSNPTRHAVEQRLAALEGGERAFAWSVGTACGQSKSVTPASLTKTLYSLTSAWTYPSR